MWKEWYDCQRTYVLDILHFKKKFYYFPFIFHCVAQSVLYHPYHQHQVFMGLIDRWDRDERASRVMTMIQVYKLIMILTTSMIQIDAMMIDMSDRVHWDDFWWENLAFSEFWFSFQEYVGCCGASGNRLVYNKSFVFLSKNVPFRDDYISIFRDDYINWHKPVPFSCRHPVTGTFSLSMLVD